MPRVALALMLAACADTQTDARLCNDTGFDMSGVKWNLRPGADLAGGACTEYETTVGGIYPTTSVQFFVGADQFQFQPVDHVGEQKFGGGEWSYRVTIVDYASRIAHVWASRD